MCEKTSTAVQATVNVGTSSTQLVGPNRHRKALIIQAPQTNRITLSLVNPAAADVGIVLYASDPPFILDSERVGAACRQPWYAISDTAAQDVTFIEVTN